MSTSDSQGKEPLTRRQMRELRLTGSTPVIGEAEESAASPVTAPREAAPIDFAPPAEVDVDLGSAPLTRRQAREQERVRTASVPVIAEAEDAAEPSTDDAAAVADEAAIRNPSSAEIVSGLPAFAPVAASPAPEAPAPETSAPEASGEAEGVEAETDEAPAPAGDASAETGALLPGESASASPDEEPAETQLEAPEADLSALGVDAEAIEEVEDDTAERPTVSSAFGSGVLTEEPSAPTFTPSFDDLITVGDTTGSQSIAPNALIFTPPAGEGSLSGPVASTGEVLITGTYELPEGIGSQGHARGVADGKDVDAVLIDGELPPSSSPTPIAASSAISTSKPAGEIIRPPAPEKGNRLMLVLAITAGGLALVLAAALVAAFAWNVFG